MKDDRLVRVLLAGFVKASNGVAGKRHQAGVRGWSVMEHSGDRPVPAVVETRANGQLHSSFFTGRVRKQQHSRFAVAGP